jgi:hypothetical protein
MIPQTRARLALAVALLLFATSALRAGPETQGMTELKRERGDHPDLRALLNGDTVADANNQAHGKALDYQARWILYRIYDVTNHAFTVPQAPGVFGPAPTTITTIFKEYQGDLSSLTRNPDKTKDAARIYAKALIARGTEVMRAPGAESIAIANAARVLALSAELGQPELADALAALIKDPPRQNQGAQYWAFKGLNELLDKHPDAVSGDRLAKVAATLSAFIEKPVTFPKEATEADIAGYRVLRREAVRALSRTRLPAYDDKNMPAMTLLKVMTANGIQPAPAIDERLIAATGLARMRPGKDGSYQVDYAVEHIGHVVADFAGFIASDKARRPPDGSKLPVKIPSALLNEELKNLVIESKDPYAGKAFKEIASILEKLEAGATPNPDPLNQWLDANKAPNTQLFKDKSGTALQPKGPESM